MKEKKYKKIIEYEDKDYYFGQHIILCLVICFITALGISFIPEIDKFNSFIYFVQFMGISALLLGLIIDLIYWYNNRIITYIQVK